MNITFSEESWMWMILNTKGDCLACVHNDETAKKLSQMYQEQEDGYYNSVDFQDDSPWYAYRYL